MPVKTPAVVKKQEIKKTLMIEQLKKVPIISVACQKVGVGRTTFYAYQKEDSVFKRKTEEALKVGVGIMNDLAESKLMQLISSGHFGAIKFWLRHRHSAYQSKVELKAVIKDSPLSTEQQKVVVNALKLGHGDEGWEIQTMEGEDESIKQEESDETESDEDSEEENENRNNENNGDKARVRKRKPKNVKNNSNKDEKTVQKYEDFDDP